MTSVLTKQLVHAHWYILEDYPKKDGDYVVCFLTSDGSYGNLDIWTFNVKTGWEPLFGYTPDGDPSHWCNLPMPK
jgi:hypothetical protein